MSYNHKTCRFCKREFVSKLNLLKHFKSKHKDQSEEIENMLSRYKLEIKCGLCDQKFLSARMLQKHKKSDHPTGRYRSLFQRCVLCDKLFRLKEIYSHFSSVHNKKIETRNLTFPTFSDFLDWKEELECDTSCNFVKMRTKQIESNCCYRFKCHRSGKFISRGEGLRQIMTSKKINGFCPAKIDVIENHYGECKVTFLDTHIGHDNKLRRLQTLTKSDRELLYTKMANNASYDDILKEIKDSPPNSQLQRLFFVTKADLKNLRFKPMIATLDDVKNEHDYSLSIIPFEIQLNDLKMEAINIVNLVKNESDLNIVRNMLKTMKATLDDRHSKKVEVKVEHIEKRLPLSKNNLNLKHKDICQQSLMKLSNIKLLKREYDIE